MATPASSRKASPVRRASTSPQVAPAADGFAAHCAELLAPLGPVRIRRMFGGHGIYLGDLFVAILAADCLYLKADAETEARFRDAGCRAFRYDAKGKAMTMGYWTVPDEAMEAPPQMAPWAQLAVAAALRARAARSAPPAPAAAHRRAKPGAAG